MPFTYARFWKCALQVNPESYNKVYRGEDHGLKGQEFLESLLTICRREGIEVVGLADHGSVQDVDAIRNYLTPHGIVVFPGFEVATTEKVHWVCLFHEETTVDQLNRYLGNLQLTDPKEGVRPSRLGGEEFLRCVEELGGFCYAAHATNESGVLKQKANHLWQNPRLRAAQIPGPVADLPQEYKSMALNQNPDYRREAKMAFINAKDVAKPEDLTKESASCYIKMTRPTFSSFITAFKDPSSRIRLHREHVRHYSRIKRVRVTSGYLDGIDIEFSDHLNAVIGGRGAGKSTLLECIRYALDCDHIGSESRKQGGQIIKENLGKTGGRVELEIVSATNHMKTYRVVRRYGEPPRAALYPQEVLD